MNRCFWGWALVLLLGTGPAVGFAAENSPGPFVEKDADERLSPDGKIEVRFIDPSPSTRKLQLFERANNRLIWASEEYNTVTDTFHTAQRMKAFFSPNSKVAVARHLVAEPDNNPRSQFFVIDVATGTVLATYDWVQHQTIFVSFSPDGRFMVVNDVGPRDPSRVDFRSTEGGGALRSPVTYRYPQDGALSAQVNSDRRTMTATIGSANYAITLPSTPPEVTITGPANNTRVARGSTVTVTTSVRDNVGVTRVDFQASGVVTATDSRNFNTLASVSPTFTFDVPDDAPFDATVTLRVTATDGAGYQASKSITVQVEPAPPPSISQVQPNTGPLAGETAIIIQGNNFQPGASVTVGTLVANGVSVLSPTAIYARAPSRSIAGTYDVRVANPDGRSSTLANAFTYISYAPVALSIFQLESTAFPTVTVFVKVLDAALQPVGGLSASQFGVSENGMAQSPITVQSQGGGQPVSVALVIDVSGSIDDAELGQVNAAAFAFVDLLKPTDRACVVKFTNTASVVQSFTTDKAAVKSAIAAARPPSGGTAIYDAAILAAGLFGAEGPRKAMVLLTDGQDFNSQQSLAAAVNQANSNQVIIYPVGFGDGIGAANLNSLAVGTGGQLFIAPAPDALQALFASISGALNAQYKITYTSSRPTKDGTTRQVVVAATIGGNSGNDSESYRAPLVLEPPVATIEAITPNPARERQVVTFTGRGTDPDGTVTAFEWSSSLEGVLGTQVSLTSSTLRVGDHTITFRVRDNSGQWSAPAIRLLKINALPQLDTSLGPSRHDPENTAVGEPVNIITGNMYMTIQDFSLPGVHEPLTFTRTYNSQSAEDGQMGFGWTNTFLTRLKKVADDFIQIRTETGGVVYFTKDAMGTWVASPGEHSTLTLTPDGQRWIWRQKSGAEQWFFSWGLWSLLAERQGTVAAIASNVAPVNFITLVTGSAGQTLRLTYTAGRLTQMRDPANRTTRYAYDQQGNLVSVTDPMGGITRYEYADPRDPHNMTRMVDANGRATTWSYDAQDRVVDTAGPSGKQRVQLAYNPSQRKTTITDSRNRRVVKEYNDDGVIVREIDHEGQTTAFEWDAQLNRTSVTDALGRTTRMAYDGRGNLLGVTDALGNVTTFQYEPLYSRLTELKDALGRKTLYTYSSRGDLLQVRDDLGMIVSYAYDAWGQLLSVADAEGRTTNYTYDSAGNLLSARDPLDRSVSFTYDAVGNRLSMTNTGGRITLFEYDALGRVTRVTLPDNTARTFQYDPVGNRTSATDALNRITRWTYDGLDQVTQTVDPLNQATTQEYDSEGNLTKVIDARAGTTTFTYDLMGRLRTVTNPLGPAAQLEYDAVNNRVASVDPEGQRVGYQYDELNRLVGVNLPDGRAIRYAYDALGRRISAAGPDGAGATTYVYDVRGRLVTVDGPNAGDAVAYMYDRTDRRLSMVDPQGRTIQYRYDAAGQLVQLADFGGRTFGYTYDANGNLTELTYPDNVKAVYAYDQHDRLLMLTQQAASGTPFFSASYSYDAAGRRTEVDFLDASVAFDYDAADRLVTETRTGSLPYAVAYNYDAAGNRVQQVANGIETTYTYNGANQLTKQTLLGRLEGRVVTVSGTTDPTATVQVCGAAGVCRAAQMQLDGSWAAQDVPLAAGSNTVTVRATDPAGNMTTSTMPVTLDAQAEVLFRYNKNGQLVERAQDGRQALFTWDTLGHLTGVTRPDGSQTLMGYDFDGRRIAMGTPVSPKELTYYYDGNNMIQQTRVGGLVDTFGNPYPATSYLWGPSLGEGVGGLLYEHAANLFCGHLGGGVGGCVYQGSDRVNYTHADGQGNVMGLHTHGNVPAQSYAYDAFGQLLGLQGVTAPGDGQTQTAMTTAITLPPITATVLFGFRFSTRPAVSFDDQATGMLYQLGARWYDPGVGRFISPDPAGFVDGPNLYAYVSNNPVNFIDPLGLVGIPLKLTDVSKIAKLADAFQYQVGGVRFRSLLRRNGESYLALSGARAAHFPLAPGGYRLDNPQVAAYLQPGAAARGYLKSSGALGTALIVTQDVANQLMSGGSLTDQRFLGHTALHVANGFIAGAIGAGVGALSTSLTLNPAVGIVAGVGTSVGVNQGLENIEHWVVHQISTN